MQNNKERNKKILIFSVLGMVLVFGLVMFLIWRTNKNVSEEEIEFSEYVDKHNNDKIIEILKDSNKIDDIVLLVLAYAEKGLNEQEKGGSQDEYVNKALDIVDKAIKDNPGNSELFRAKGYVYEIKPDLNMAIDSYKKSIEFDGNNFRAYTGLGHVYQMKGMISLAFQNYEKAKDLDKLKQGSMSYLGLCIILRGGDDVEAIKNCNDVIDNGFSDSVAKASAHFTLASIYLEKDLELAGEHIKLAHELDPGADTLAVLARINIKEGNMDEAKKNAELAIRREPNSGFAYLIMAEVLYLNNDFNKAIEIAEKGVEIVDKDVSILIYNKYVVKNKMYEIISNSYDKKGNSEKSKEFKDKINEFSDSVINNN